METGQSGPPVEALEALPVVVGPEHVHERVLGQGRRIRQATAASGPAAEASKGVFFLAVRGVVARLKGEVVGPRHGLGRIVHVVVAVVKRETRHAPLVHVLLRHR